MCTLLCACLVGIIYKLKLDYTFNYEWKKKL